MYDLGKHISEGFTLCKILINFVCLLLNLLTKCFHSKTCHDNNDRYIQILIFQICQQTIVHFMWALQFSPLPKNIQCLPIKRKKIFSLVRCLKLSVKSAFLAADYLTISNHSM